MTLVAEVVRPAALVMAVAYAAMALGAFRPAMKRHAAERAPIRGTRHVPLLVDRLWVATQGLVVLLLLAALAVPQWLLDWPLAQSRLQNAVAAFTGVAVFVAGCALIARAARHLGAELTVAIETREGGKLVTTGPYSRIRHPIYTGVFLLVGGEALALGSPLLAAYLFVAVACARMRALAEEELLANDPVHGPAYRNYLARTGRFGPAWLKKTP